MQKLIQISIIILTPIIFNRKDIRLTVDTIEDFELSKEIYAKLISKSKDFGIVDIINFIDNNPKYLEIMKSQIIKNTK